MAWKPTFRLSYLRKLKSAALSWEVTKKVCYKKILRRVVVRHDLRLYGILVWSGGAQEECAAEKYFA